MTTVRAAIRAIATIVRADARAAETAIVRGGYQGSRDGNRQGGYQGRNDGNRQGGYQGRNDGKPPGRRLPGKTTETARAATRKKRRKPPGRRLPGRNDGNRQGGYQGRNDGNRQGGYQEETTETVRVASRAEMTTVRGGNRGGMGITKPSFDTPLAQKQQNTKQSKNAYKKSMTQKKDRDMEMKGKTRKGPEGRKSSGYAAAEEGGGEGRGDQDHRDPGGYHHQRNSRKR